ncbi:MAG: GNAT family N-acetyltransferase [Deltaproteobacteria bacterium]|nr:GNAT family N-acetyltransferase [Deltaproteobacteria bacterium]MBW1819453.1 GNAT family N-acetyltransferase [Deltaproteobacteria bacterium]MBW2285596.1 GNAT family N-acetyltransferase [Deltaproteobacteria bacterium]
MGQQGRYGKYGEHKRMERLLRGKAPGTGRPGRGGFFRPGRWALERKEPAPDSGLSARPAGRADAEHVHAMSRMFRAYGPYQDILREWHESGAAIAFIGLRDNRPAGFAMMGRISAAWHFPRVAELLAIAVEPSSRRRGLAGLMLQEVEETAAALGAERLILHTGVDNVAARTLFLTHGFTVLDTCRAFYPEGQDALCMIKDLGHA